MAIETEHERAKHYRARAAVVQELASNGSNLKIRRQLLGLAKQWDLLAGLAQGLAKREAAKRPMAKKK